MAADGHTVPGAGPCQEHQDLAPTTGPRCQHLRLLKLQGEPVDMREAFKAQEAVSDFMACISQEDQQPTLPDLVPLRLTHPTNWREHAKGLCECVFVNSSA